MSNVATAIASEPRPRAASITLTSADMGDVTEADFDAWVAYVSERIDEFTGLDVTVDAARFGAGGADRIVAENDEDRQTLRRAISVDLWEKFCADASAWPQA